MTLSLNVSLPALVSSFNGERSESECQAAIDAAWDALTVADLGVSLEYTAMGLQLRSHTVTVEETDEDEDIDGNAASQDVSYRWQAAISAAFGQIDLDNAAKPREFNGERVVEYMPTYLRASHEAAGNSGSYPANGAIRVLVGANEQIDEDEWTSVVRPATVADLTRYADATESDYNDGMGG